MAVDTDPKPILLTVDDDPGVSRAVARDLRRRYGEHYWIVRAESGPSALDALRFTDVVRQVFPALRADRWQIARATPHGRSGQPAPQPPMTGYRFRSATTRSAEARTAARETLPAATAPRIASTAWAS